MDKLLACTMLISLPNYVNILTSFDLIGVVVADGDGQFFFSLFGVSQFCRNELVNFVLVTFSDDRTELGKFGVKF